MRRFIWLVFLPAGLVAQQPAVSPALPRLLNRVHDTTVSVWLFLQPWASLETVSDRVAAAGGRVRVRSRWLQGVSADVPASVLRQFLHDRDLRRVQPLGRFKLRPPRPGRPALDLAPGVILAPAAGPGDTCGVTPGDDPVLGPSAMPYRQLHLRPLTDQGVDATGVRIALLDTGFDTSNPAFNGITITAQYDFVFHDDTVMDQPGKDVAGAQTHGTATWSLFAGDVPGRLHGIARGAHYLLAKTEDVRSETRVEEDNFVHALEWADSIGVDIVSSSLGYLSFDNGFSYTPSQLNGDIAVTSMGAEIAAQRGILVVTAAGNDGPAFRTLVTPGDADSVLTIGAEDSLGTIAFFSSRGPTADRRLKPDFTAPGAAVCVLWNAQVRREDGTSFATPLIAASAALVKQMHPTLLPMDLRAAFRSTATKRMAPDSTYGWGRPDVAAAAVFPGGVTATAPLPAAGPLTTITPTFSWTVGTVPAAATPVTYRLRIGRDSAMTAPIVDRLTTAQTFAIPQALKAGRLFWQVDATAASGETATSGVIGPIIVPPWATLTTLSNPAGMVIDTAQPTFRWKRAQVSAPPGPPTFDLGVQRVATGVNEVNVTNLTDTMFALPQPLERNTAYRWLLVVHAGSDTSIIRSQGSFLVVDLGMPTSTLLYQNFPNPFPAAGRDSTCLWFDLALAGNVQLDILDLRGNRVRRFVPGPDFPGVLAPGRYGRGSGTGGICDPRLMWDGRTDDGHPLPAGVYLAKLKAPGLLVFKRIVFRGK
jgi:hypothetical protein